MQTILFVLLGIFALALSASAAEPTRQVLLDKPLSANADTRGVTLMIDWPAGSEVARHTHPGDEYAVVLDGAIEVTTDGGGVKTYNAGEAYHNARDVVHSSRAAGGKPARTLATLVVEKDRPLSVPVQ
mgnify:CR=1 FL=1